MNAMQLAQLLYSEGWRAVLESIYHLTNPRLLFRWENIGWDNVQIVNFNMLQYWQNKTTWSQSAVIYTYPEMFVVFRQAGEVDHYVGCLSPRGGAVMEYSMPGLREQFHDLRNAHQLGCVEVLRALAELCSAEGSAEGGSDAS